MLRRLIHCLIALNFAFAGPVIAHAHQGMGHDADELCALHGGSSGDTAHHGGHQDGQGDVGKSSGKACCQAHCPNQILIEPTAVFGQAFVFLRTVPTIAHLLIGQSAPPDLPPPRL